MKILFHIALFYCILKIFGDYPASSTPTLSSVEPASPTSFLSTLASVEKDILHPTLESTSVASSSNSYWMRRKEEEERLVRNGELSERNPLLVSFAGGRQAEQRLTASKMCHRGRLQWVSRNKLSALIKNLPSNEKLIALFYSPSCTFCDTLLTVVTHASPQFPTIPFYALNCGAFPLRSVGYGVVAFPTLLLFHNDDVVSRYTGAYNVTVLLDWITVEAEAHPVSAVEDLTSGGFLSFSIGSYLHPSEYMLAMISGVVSVLYSIHLLMCAKRVVIAWWRRKRQNGGGGSDSGGSTISNGKEMGT